MWVVASGVLVKAAASVAAAAPVPSKSAVNMDPIKGTGQRYRQARRVLR